nr:protein NLP7-like [Ipomoea batatas]
MPLAITTIPISSNTTTLASYLLLFSSSHRRFYGVASDASCCHCSSAGSEQQHVGEEFGSSSHLLPLSQSPDFYGVASDDPAAAATVHEAGPSNIPPAAAEAGTSNMWVVKVEYMGDILRVSMALPLLKELKAAVSSRRRHLKGRRTVLKFLYKDQEGDMIVIACDEDLQLCFKYFKTLNQTVRWSLVAIYH